MVWAPQGLHFLVVLIYTLILNKMKENLHHLTNSKMIEGKEKGMGGGLSSFWDAFGKSFAKVRRANSENKLLLKCRLPQSETADPAGRFQSLGALFQNKWWRQNQGRQRTHQVMMIIDILNLLIHTETRIEMSTGDFTRTMTWWRLNLCVFCPNKTVTS